MQLSFTQLGLDPQLMKMLASGTPFKEVDVLGYDVGPNGSSHLAVDYSFGLVAGKTLTIDQTGTTQLALEYGSEQIQEYGQKPNGSFSTTPTSTSAWDRVKNVSGFSTDHTGAPIGETQDVASALAPPLTLPKSGVSAGANPPLQYYVRFELYNGTTVTVNGDQLFALKTFSFTDEQTLNIGSSSSGAGAGKVTFDPLQLSFTQLGLDPQLMKMLASGTPFKEVDVLGYDVGPTAAATLRSITASAWWPARR